MNEQTGLKLLAASWFAMMGLEFWSSVTQGQGLPSPVPLIRVNVVWSLLTLASAASAPLAGMLGIGAFVGTLVLQPQWLKPTGGQAKLAAASIPQIPTNAATSSLASSGTGPQVSGLGAQSAPQVTGA